MSPGVRRSSESLDPKQQHFQWFGIKSPNSSSSLACPHYSGHGTTQSSSRDRVQTATGPARRGSRTCLRQHGPHPLQVDGPQCLLEPGSAVNAPRDACGQSPVHLAAQAGHPYFLLWQLQAGADLNQQDAFGEAPIHKAAKVGSLECLSLLVASDALIDLRNKNGQTAEDLAWSCGFLECAKFLTTVKHTQSMKLCEQSKHSFNTDKRGLLLKNKRAYRNADNSNGKKQRSDGM
ncbi:ankyrin repeat domain-containing protein 37 isoform X3 [Dromiciops gliroides]|uniref:ankyrin repeat domain-containing protein 37 isoform X3 n=1 Tax=Dromiciops gliroides TaxID=33562 RepID=UPI001CC4BE73|nr:ankyrin repeat domain-containing protein 37 isoform X3 [Dromiciops gliroides]